MAKKKRRALQKSLCLLLIPALLIFLISATGFSLSEIDTWIESAAVLSTMLTIPEGGQQAAREAVQNQQGLSSESSAESVTVNSKPSKQESSGDSSSEETSSQSTVSSMPKVPPEGVKTGTVTTKFLDPASANLQWENIYISNKTKEHTVDIATEIKNLPNVSIEKNGEPQVLIFHTHATEKYLNGDVGYYIAGESSHTDDNSQNVVRVGDEIAKQLEEAGIVTLHDTTQHDNPSYNGSYDRSAQTIQKYLKEYPSIQVVLDIHRDAITSSDGTKTKPTVEVDGKKAAQIMICAGCQEGSVEGFEHWMENMRLALRIQQACETDYPGLARPIYFVAKKYNEYLSPGSLLIEMGSEANTLDEAIYSGQLLGKALVKVLNGLLKE